MRRGEVATDSRATKWYLIPSLELVLVVAGSVAMLAGSSSRVDPAIQMTETGFLIGLVIFFGWFVVRLDRGRLRLTMIGTQAAAMVLSPPLAGLVGLVAGVSWFRQGPDGYRYLGVGATVFWAATASLIRTAIGSASPIEAAAGLVAVATWMTLMNWMLTLGALAILTQEPARRIARSAFSRIFIAAFIYFSLAAILIASLLDGSLRGYVLSGVVALLSVALMETLAERRSRAALEAQVADSQRHLGYSRAVEGTVHTLRHQLAISKGYLEDLLEARLAALPRGRAQSAKASTDAALKMLDRLSASASPRVEIAEEPIDLKEIATVSAEMVRGLAAGQRTRVEVSGQVRPVLVSGDPALLRDVVTELLINALQAVRHGGTITLSTGTRRGGWANLSVADTGPGISDQQRDHLFEPHYTTKPGGTGMGLFTAFGIVREHGGQLIYEGGPKHRAVFTLLIPIVASSLKSAEAVPEPGDGLNPASIA
jgi:signal transduction histidine kinase